MITIQIDNKAIEPLLKLARELNVKSPGGAVHKGFKAGAMIVERKLKENISGRLLHARSGHLRASMGSRVDETESGVIATIGSGARQGERIKYADIHEKGGTITPRISQYLTIPLDAAKTPAGVTRFTARDVRDGATKYDSSFVRKGIIFGVLKRGGSSKRSIVPLFVLKTSVNIPASHYHKITAEESAKEVNAAVAIGVINAIEGGGK